MSADMVYELRGKLADALKEGVTDEAIAKAEKQMRDLCDAAMDDIKWRLKDQLAENLAWQVQDWFRRAIEAMFDGNEAEFRRYLNADPKGYTGRDNADSYIGQDGKPFEYGCIVWRRKLVDAFPEILKSERILDLEAQVKSMGEEILKLRQRNESLVRDLNEWKQQ